MYNIGNLILNGTMVVTTFWIVNRFLGSVYEKRQGNVWSIAYCEAKRPGLRCKTAAFRF